jgi:hypothetical protein
MLAGFGCGLAVSVVSRKVRMDTETKAALRDWRFPAEALPDIPKGSTVENVSRVTT